MEPPRTLVRGEEGEQKLLVALVELAPAHLAAGRLLVLLGVSVVLPSPVVPDEGPGGDVEQDDEGEGGREDGVVVQILPPDAGPEAGRVLCNYAIII